MHEPSRRAVLKTIGITAGAVAAGSVLPVASASAAGVSAASAAGGPVADPPQTTNGFAAQFANPDIEARAWFRYWIPDATVTPAEVRADIAAMAAGGFGGFEIACLTHSGQTLTSSDIWGSPAWVQIFEAALSEGRAHNLHASAYIGPTWPAAVPSITLDSTASSKLLATGYTTVAAGASFSGAVPSGGALPTGATQQTLVAVLAYQCAEATVPSSGTIPLTQASCVNLTSRVTGGSSSQAISWTAPSGGNPWILVAFWQQPTGQSLDDGYAIVVDHYGTAGANAVTSFWDTHLLTAEVRAVLKSIPLAIFEDSIELASNLHWTPDMLAQFSARRGYDLTDYLAALPTAAAVGFGSTGAALFDFTDVTTSRVIQDFNQTLSDLYLANHIYAIQDWCHRRNLGYKAQAYGGEIDTTLAAATIDYPEGESLDDGQHTEKWRVIAGGAHLGRRNILSAEADATLNNAYGLTWAEDMLPMSNGNFASGVNRDIIHGYPSYNGPGAVWPGNDGFGGTTIGDNWGPRMPTWTHIQDMSGYLARCQYVNQLGTPKIDIAVYRSSLDIGYGSAAAGVDVWTDTALAGAGYTYDYQSEGSIALPAAQVRGGILAPDGPAYRALILFNQTTLSLGAVGRFIAFARAGLPIIVVGDAPSTTPGWYQHARQDASLATAFNQLLARKNVRQVSAESDVLAALAAIGILPAARFADQQPDLATVRRDTPLGQFYFLANVGSSQIDTTVSFTGSGTPYRLDPYSGKVTPLGVYRVSGGHTSVGVSITGEDSTIIALDARGGVGAAAPARHAVSSTVPVVVRGNSLVAQASSPGSYSTTLDNGKVVTKTVSAVPAATELSSWALTVQEWLPGPTATTTVKQDVQVGLESLVPWSKISAVANASGIGTYTTSFTAPAQNGAVTGAVLDLGDVCDTFRVTVNGMQLPPTDIINTTVDIGRYLKAGTNKLTVEVATPLLNAVRVARGGIWASQAQQDYGLIGPVYIRPYIEYAL